MACLGRSFPVAFVPASQWPGGFGGLFGSMFGQMNQMMQAGPGVLVFSLAGLQVAVHVAQMSHGIMNDCVVDGALTVD